MEIVEVKCTNCGKELYIQNEYVREEMFCTLGCMDLYSKENAADDFKFH